MLSDPKPVLYREVRRKPVRGATEDTDVEVAAVE